MNLSGKITRAYIKGNYKVFVRLYEEGKDDPQVVKTLGVCLEYICTMIENDRERIGEQIENFLIGTSKSVTGEQIEILNFLLDKGIRMEEWNKKHWPKIWDIYETLLRKRKLSQL